MMPTTDFLAAYIGMPLFFILYVFWKIFKRTKWLSPLEADLHTGKDVMDAEDAHWPDLKPKNAFEKFWFWLA